MSDPLRPLFSGSDGALARLERGASAAEALAATVRAALPEALRPHVLAANRRGDDLVVIVDSAAWAARVRYAGTRVREQLDAQGIGFTGRLRVRVGRSASPPPG
jgi:hypothetical protein